ncbi:unnamed protein product [Arctogadus glacialis]
MVEVIHPTPNMARNTQVDGEEGIEDICASMESLRDQHQDYVGTEETSNTLGTVRSQQPDPVSSPRCPIRAVVVLLVLLIVVLLARLLGLAVQHKTVLEKTVSMDRDMEQLLQRLKNVTEQHKTVLEKTVSMDRDTEQLLQRLKNVTEQRDALLCPLDCPDLVVVDSKEDMDFISRYGANWLGATDEASEALWRWVDGTVLSVENPSWSGGKPDGGKDKNCLKSFGEKTNLKWTDESCEANHYGLCEYNLMK